MTIDAPVESESFKHCRPGVDDGGLMAPSTGHSDVSPRQPEPCIVMREPRDWFPLFSCVAFPAIGVKLPAMHIFMTPHA
jgi:hypothetical protein